MRYARTIFFLFLQNRFHIRSRTHFLINNQHFFFFIRPRFSVSYFELSALQRITWKSHKFEGFFLAAKRWKQMYVFVVDGVQASHKFSCIAQFWNYRLFSYAKGLMKYRLFRIPWRRHTVTTYFTLSTKSHLEPQRVFEKFDHETKQDFRLTLKGFELEWLCVTIKVSFSMIL